MKDHIRKQIQNIKLWEQHTTRTRKIYRENILWKDRKDNISIESTMHWFGGEVDRVLSHLQGFHVWCGLPHSYGTNFEGIRPGVSHGRLWWNSHSLALMPKLNEVCKFFWETHHILLHGFKSYSMEQRELQQSNNRFTRKFPSYKAENASIWACAPIGRLSTSLQKKLNLTLTSKANSSLKASILLSWGDSSS